VDGAPTGTADLREVRLDFPALWFRFLFFEN
jgi:hypothetical protein